MILKVISRVFLFVSILCMFIGVIMAISPGHRRTSQLVQRDGTINRANIKTDKILKGDSYEYKEIAFKRLIDEIEYITVDQERQWDAVRKADGYILFSWLCVVIAYTLNSQSLRSMKRQLEKNE